MGSLSIWHWLIVILVVVLLFGRNKISDLMGDVARGVKSFKKGLSDDDDEGPRGQAGGHRRRRGGPGKDQGGLIAA